VNHDLLLEKLHNYGRGELHQLIHNYLTNRMQIDSNRQQRVKIKSNTGEYNIIDTRIPQSTILGPLFFILYINFILLTVMPRFNYILCRWHCDLSKWCNSIAAARVKMNHLQRVSLWLALNKLSLNLDKTVYMIFGNVMWRPRAPRRKGYSRAGEESRGSSFPCLEGSDLPHFRSKQVSLLIWI